jgi:hypothetical protein
MIKLGSKAVAIGAEACLHRIEERAKDEGWFLAKEFKTHLYPEDATNQPNQKINGKSHYYSQFY